MVVHHWLTDGGTWGFDGFFLHMAKADGYMVGFFLEFCMGWPFVLLSSSVPLLVSFYFPFGCLHL